MAVYETLVVPSLMRGSKAWSLQNRHKKKLCPGGEELYLRGVCGKTFFANFKYMDI